MNDFPPIDITLQTDEPKVLRFTEAETTAAFRRCWLERLEINQHPSPDLARVAFDDGDRRFTFQEDGPGLLYVMVRCEVAGDIHTVPMHEVINELRKEEL